MQIHFTVERNHVVEQDYTDTFVTNKTFQEVVADAFPNFVCWEKLTVKCSWTFVWGTTIALFVLN